MSGRRLLADIGGTNARFACVDDNGDLSNLLTLNVADYACFYDSLAHYLETSIDPAELAGAVIAAAGPVAANVLSLTNCDWRIRAADVSAQLGGVPVRLFNDLEAVALALPHLGEGDLRWIGNARPGVRSNTTRMLALNVGTGFGAATVIATTNGWASCPSEAGHMTLDIIAAQSLNRLLGRASQAASVEDVLSGAGLVHLYQSVAQATNIMPISGRDEHQLPTPREICTTTGSDVTAGKVLAALTRVLGSVTGNMVLASAAWDGAYLCGSVARAWAEAADFDVFRGCFEDKGKMTSVMRSTPTAIILVPNPAFIGLASVRIS